MKPKCKIIVSHLPYTLSPDILRSKLVLSFPDSDSVRDGIVNNYGNDEMREVTDSARPSPCKCSLVIQFMCFKGFGYLKYLVSWILDSPLM